ncbi:hypothetical protein [Pseudodesulfovibrio sediminis]|uniref:Uncharacterized protein n=1 Tax=Pseudodesulfovibrio sediminis TaxID=2810563 RepID=A0ABN6EVX4_9BACT|nr:hypothetical protein [Pseudodesulfovibrio sediminis]BCS89186.1 hypothetical protein PSDVSF_24280 [Pseudodesulfovibrio sediminis]
MGDLMSHVERMAERAALDLAGWVRVNGFAGYDPYDLPGYLFDRRCAGDPVSSNDETRLREQDRVDPGGLRAELGLAPAVNAKALGLLLGAFSILHDGGLGDWTDEMALCVNWLDENAIPGFAGTGWGYPFNWESYQVIPAGTPTSVNSCHVGDGFRQRYLATGDTVWLGRCQSVAEFLFSDLNEDHVSGRGRCYSYTPIDFFHVHNANLGTAEFLVWTGLTCGREEFVLAGQDALAFTLSDLDDRGTLTYWARGFEPNEGLVGFMDHYHTAAELRSLLRLTRMLPEQSEVRAAFDRYFHYYLTEFFDDHSRPVLRPGFSWLPFDIHAGAEAAYILGESVHEHPAAKDRLVEFLPWFLSTCRNPDGSYLFRIEECEGKECARTFPFLRWGQAWTLRGLCAVLTGLRGI